MFTTTLILVIVVALIFEFINGFHDTANAIATVVATRVLTPLQAILMAGIFNFAGAITGTAVAKTIGSGFVDPQKVTLMAVIATLTAAITWNLITWYKGIPSSSSHALIGGILGAAIAQAGMDAPNWSAVMQKVVLPLIISPIAGFFIAAIVLTIILRLFGKLPPATINGVFGRLQIFSAMYMAYSHGSNDAQKTMGIITLALVTCSIQTTFDIPMWVIFSCATVMGLGTLAGGWRIIRTMSNKLANLKPVDGFAAETVAATVIEIASKLGFPLSTTHVITASIMGSGIVRRPETVRWSVATNIIVAWVLTIPSCIGLSYITFKLISLV